jgi:hypothetical protein
MYNLRGWRGRIERQENKVVGGWYLDIEDTIPSSAAPTQSERSCGIMKWGVANSFWQYGSRAYNSRGVTWICDWQAVAYLDNVMNSSDAKAH